MSGKRFPIWVRAGAALAALTAIAAGGAPALAQTAPDDCAALALEDQVACLQRVLAETQEALARTQRALDEASEAADADAQDDSGGWRLLPRGLFSGGDQLEENPQATPVAADGLGAEQLAVRAGVDRDTPNVEAMIVSSERVHPNRLQVVLDNGQIWRQIEGDTQIVTLRNGDPVAVEMWSSGFGGFRMRMPGIGRTLKVERLR